jgi:hypothetical protein
LSDIYSRSRMQRRVILVLGLVVAVLSLLVVSAVRADAQVTGPPHVFVAGTVISPDEMNLNFSTVYDAALNRTGGTMTGALAGTSATFSSTLGVAGATTLAALSATTGTFSSTLAVTGAATFTSTVAINSTSASALDVAGGITAGSGNVAVIDTTGKIPAISSTYFASLSGANLTGIPETAITDDSLLARVAGSETISGLWSFTHGSGLGISNATEAILNLTNTTASTTWKWSVNTSGTVLLTETGVSTWFQIAKTTGTASFTGSVGAGGAVTVTNATPVVKFIESDQAANSQRWRTAVDSRSWNVQSMNDAESVINTAMQVTLAASGSPTIQQINLGAPLHLLSFSHGGFPTPNASDVIFCSNCTAGSTPCASGGNGAIAIANGAAWRCI